MNQLVVKQKEELVELFYNVPTRQQTLEMCEAAIEVNGDAIQYVSKRLMSEELCIKAINNKPQSFFLLGKEQMSSHLLYALFKCLNEKSEKKELGQSKWSFLNDLRVKFNRLKGIELKDLINKEVALEMVAFDGNATLYLPSELKEDVDVITVAVKGNKGAIAYIPKESQTKEMILNAVEGGVEIRYMNEALLDDELVDEMIKKNGLYFASLPAEKQTYERCLVAVKTGLMGMQIPKELYSQELFDTLIEARPNDIKDVPEEFVHRQMLLDAADNSAILVKFATFDEAMMDEELAHELAGKGVSLEPTWMQKFQTKEMVEVAVEKNAYEIRYVRPRFMTKELMCKTVMKNSHNLYYIPKMYIDEELCYLAVLNGETLANEIVVEHQSERIINALIERDYFKSGAYGMNRRHQEISLVKKELQTRAFFKKILVSNPYALEGAIEEVIDEELCYLAVCNGAGLDHEFMKKHQSQRIVDKAFELGFKCLEYVREEFMTTDIISQAMDYSGLAIDSIPRTKLTEELCYLHVSKGHRLSELIPKELQSKRIAEKAFENHKMSYPYIADEYKTEEMSREAFKYDCSLVTDIPEKFQTKEMWIKALNETNTVQYLLNYIPEKFCTDEVLAVPVERQWRNIFTIPEAYRTPSLWMVAYEQDAEAERYFDF